MAAHDFSDLGRYFCKWLVVMPMLGETAVPWTSKDVTAAMSSGRRQAEGQSTVDNMKGPQEADALSGVIRR